MAGPAAVASSRNGIVVAECHEIRQGGAWFCRLRPLVSAELAHQGLDRRLNVGSLPAVFDAPRPQEDLKAYVGGYRQEEIRAEGLVRSIESF